MTSKSPLVRLDEHRFDVDKGSNYVYFHGLCLMPSLYSHLNADQLSRDNAVQKERDLAKALRLRGFCVFAGHHDISA